jgi:hypothetical protein
MESSCDENGDFMMPNSDNNITKNSSPRLDILSRTDINREIKESPRSSSSSNSSPRSSSNKREDIVRSRTPTMRRRSNTLPNRYEARHSKEEVEEFYDKNGNPVMVIVDRMS